MKKILFYLHFAKAGGAEKIAMEYIQGLFDKGYAVDLIIDFNLGIDGNTFQYAIPKGVNFQYIKSQRISIITYNLRTLGKKYKFFNIFLYFFIIVTDFYYYHRKVKNLVLSGHYDWVISFYQFLPSYLTNIKSSKHIIWLHGSIEHFFGKFTRFFKNSYGNKLNSYDYIVTIADEMKEQLEKYYPEISREKIRKIYNPFDFEKIRSKSIDFSQINEYERNLLKANYLCTVVRLDEHQKDTTSLIKAFKKLYDLNIKTHKLYIIGDGPHRNQLEDLVKEYKLENYIIFLGMKVNPYIWMKNADIFILSSKFEGLPTVLIEAMALETFVISSDCKTGPKEILSNGKCGDLFDIGDINMLTEKILFALLNPKYRNNRIEYANTYLNNFCKDPIIDQIEKLFI